MADHVCVRPGASGVIACAAVALALLPGGLRAQPAPSRTVAADVQVIADGWAALRKGELQQAAQMADRAIAEYPRSAAAVALAVEVDVTRGGALAGLTVYERWLADRRVDDPYVLRRIAQVHLGRVAANRQHPARLHAARALVADGDMRVRAELAEAAAQGAGGEAEALASAGDTAAVRDLVGRLQAPGGSKVRVINALGESRSAQAVPALVPLLKDPREEHRAAAAEALGRLGAADAVPRLRTLLDDPVFPVRLAAAGALYRLANYDGVNLLEEMMASEHGAIRLGAAEAMAVRPSESWRAVVRALTQHDDATVQLGAARLIAPYEPELAASVLERLGRSDNPAIREEASRAVVERLAADFATLRAYLRSADPGTTVRAAARILELTR